MGDASRDLTPGKDDTDAPSPLQRDVAKCMRNRDGEMGSELRVSVSNCLYGRRPEKTRNKLLESAMRALIEEGPNQAGTQARARLMQKHVSETATSNVEWGCVVLNARDSQSGQLGVGQLFFFLYRYGR